MTKLVHEDVVRESVVRRNRAVEIENSTATVSPIVYQNLDELVRRKLRHFSQRAVIESQHIPFGSERVVSRADG